MGIGKGWQLVDAAERVQTAAGWAGLGSLAGLGWAGLGWAGRCGLIAQPAVTMARAGGGQRCTAVIYYPQSADQIPGMMQPGLWSS